MVVAMLARWCRRFMVIDLARRHKHPAFQAVEHRSDKEITLDKGVRVCVPLRGGVHRDDLFKRSEERRVGKECW